MMSVQVVYVSSAGHSGSSLLDHLLGIDETFVGLGEVHRASIGHDNRRCACGEILPNCPFWRPVWKSARKALGRNPVVGAYPDEIRRRRVTTAAWIASPRLGKSVLRKSGLYRIARDSAEIYRAASAHAKSDFVVDSTKNVSRLLALASTPGLDLRVIRLRRDGRAVAASEIRRTGSPMAVAAVHWVTANLKIDAVLRDFDPSRVFDLTYEELCGSPRETLSRLTRWLGCGRGWAPDSDRMGHQIPGNPMLLGNVKSVVLDDAWRRQLQVDDLKQFGRLAGWLNRRYGYR